jgi:hypothetical protein
MQIKLLGINNVDFEVIDQRLIKVYISDRYGGGEEKRSINGRVRQL